MYTNSEDGLYGPAVDNDFATNKWVYLFYSPQTVVDVKLSDGAIVTQTTPNDGAAGHVADQDRVGSRGSATSSSAASSSSRTRRARAWTSASEQQIMKVPVNRQECCHVAGDIDFDKHNNLWLVTGDDNPAGGINGGGFGPANDMLTDEQQTVRSRTRPAARSHSRFKGQTTAPLAFDATAAQVDSRARGAEHDRGQRRPGHGRAGQRPDDHRLLPARAAARPTSRR